MRTQTKLLLVLLFCLALLAVPNLRVVGAEFTLEVAMSEHPAKLADGYLRTRNLLESVRFVGEGGYASLELGYVTITKENAQEYEALYENYLDVYLEAIRQRGYKNVAGRYSATATDSCGAIGSTWAGLIQEGAAMDIRIAQDGFDMALILDMVTGTGKELVVESKGVIVESIFVISDPMYQTYFAVGFPMGDQTYVRPSPDILANWPDWAGPPAKQDILDCIVKLSPIKDGVEPQTP